MKVTGARFLVGWGGAVGLGLTLFLHFRVHRLRVTGYGCVDDLVFRPKPVPVPPAIECPQFQFMRLPWIPMLPVLLLVGLLIGAVVAFAFHSLTMLPRQPEHG